MTLLSSATEDTAVTPAVVEARRQSHAQALGGIRVKLLPHAIVAVAVAAGIALAIPAFAAKPSGPYLNVSSAGAAPTNGSVSSPFTLSGCGYTKLTTIIVWHNYTGPYTEVTPDANGCVSATFSSFGTDPSGSYTAQSWQQQGHGWDKSAEVSFNVS